MKTKINSGKGKIRRFLSGFSYLAVPIVTTAIMALSAGKADANYLKHRSEDRNLGVEEILDREGNRNLDIEEILDREGLTDQIYIDEGIRKDEFGNLVLMRLIDIGFVKQIDIGSYVNLQPFLENTPTTLQEIIEEIRLIPDGLFEILPQKIASDFHNPIPLYFQKDNPFDYPFGYSLYFSKFGNQLTFKSNSILWRGNQFRFDSDHTPISVYYINLEDGRVVGFKADLGNLGNFSRVQNGFQGYLNHLFATLLKTSVGDSVLISDMFPATDCHGSFVKTELSENVLEDILYNSIEKNFYVGMDYEFNCPGFEWNIDATFQTGSRERGEWPSGALKSVSYSLEFDGENFREWTELALQIGEYHFIRDYLAVRKNFIDFIQERGINGLIYKATGFLSLKDKILE